MATPAIGFAVAQAGIGMLGAHEQGKADKKTLRAENKIRTRNIKELEAEGGRTAADERLKGSHIKSRAVSLMAASGGGVDTERLADIESQADYNAMAALHEANTKADFIRDEIKLAKKQARSDRKSNMLNSAVGGIGMIGSAAYG